MKKDFYLIGLTGNIGSGKSTASRLLCELGAGFVDADKVGHSIYEPGMPAYFEVLKAFGERFLDEKGRIRRRELGAYVFSDESGQRLQLLNSITHPIIIREIFAQVDLMKAEGYPAVVLEAIGLLDSPLTMKTDEIWVVTAPREVLLKRVMARDNCDEATAAGRLDKQLSPEEMAARADRVFINDGSADELRKKLTAAYCELTGISIK